MGVNPILTKKVQKKHTKKVERYQSDRFDRVNVSDFIANAGTLTFSIAIMEKAKRYRRKSKKEIQRNSYHAQHRSEKQQKDQIPH